ncbi:Cell division protein FtsQ [subsurface metagenome]
MKKRRTYRRPHRYRRKKPIFRKRFFWLGILSILVFIGVFYSLLFLEAFQVGKIIVSGEEKVSKEDVEFLAERRLESKVLFFKTKSIFTVDLKQIKRDILNHFPQIAEVKVSRGFFDAVNIVVRERIGVALWCQDEQCFLLDNEGVIFEEVSEIKPGLLLIKTQAGLAELGETVIDGDQLSQIFDIRLKLAERTKIFFAGASLISEERLDVKTTEDWQIYFNLKGDLDWQITELSLVLEKQISPERRDRLEYIDLRFSRVYYK